MLSLTETIDYLTIFQNNCDILIEKLPRQIASGHIFDILYISCRVYPTRQQVSLDPYLMTDGRSGQNSDIHTPNIFLNQIRD